MAKGSVTPGKTPNTWRLFYSMGYHPVTGKRVQKSERIKAKNKTEAEKALVEFVAKHSKGGLQHDTVKTVADLVDLWIRDYATPNLAPRTVHRHKQLSVRIKEGMGRVPLNRLNVGHVNAFINNLSAPGLRKDKRAGSLSDTTILHYYRMLNNIFETGFRWGILHENPCWRRRQPKVEARQSDIHENKNLAIILEALEKESVWFRAMCNLALITGARVGEYLALNWSDLDVEAKTVRITKTWQYLPKSGCSFKETKTRKSRRLIVIDQDLIDLLEKWRVVQDEAKEKLGNLWLGEDDAIFTTPTGRRIHPTNPNKVWAEFLERIKVPHVKLQALRNTMVSLLVRSKEDVKSISDRVGHSRVTTTLDVYTQTVSDGDNRVISTLRSVINGIRAKHKPEPPTM